MGKSKSSHKKDDDKKKKGFKKKSEKNSNSLKSLKANQKQSPAPDNKSLKSLKKIQKQLDEIVAHREAENKRIKALKKTTSVLSKQTSALSEQNTTLSKQASSISKQVKKTESRLSKRALNKDLQRIKTSLDKKSSQFDKESSKLSKEIALFKDLTHRVEHKIQVLESRLLEKETSPSAEQLESLNKNNALLFKKISYFEEELNQFSETYLQPGQSTAEFAEQLTLLNQIINQLSKNYDEHDTQIKLLQTDTSNIRKSLQLETSNFQQESLSHQRDIESHQRDIKSHQHAIEDQQQGMDVLKETVTNLQHNMGEHQQALKSIDAKMADFLPQTDRKDEQNSQQKEQYQAFEQQFKQEHQQELQQLSNTISTIENSQQQLISPLEAHLQELDKNIQSLQQDIKKQENQFNEQRSHEPDKDTASIQFDHFNETLNKLSQQIYDVTEQANNLQHSFSEVQAQQNTDNAHHEELLKQYLFQQQQLEKHERQLAKLIPILSQSEVNTQQLEQISDSLSQLSNIQNNLAHLENDFQANLLTLDKKVDKGHRQYQKNIDELVGHQRKTASYQQEQSVSLKQLSEQIKTRSLLFGIGLISVLTISTLLFFKQEVFNQDSFNQASSTQANKQALIAQIKTDITNETFTEINALTRQNSSIINEQLVQIRESIEQVRNQAVPAPQTTSSSALQDLENTWREQHQILQEGLSKTQSEQQELNKTVVQLSETVSTVSNQLQQLQKSVAENFNASPRNKQSEIEIITIQKSASPFYTIQLLGALQKKSVFSFIRQHHLSDTSRIYQTKLQDKPWYILVQGHYPSYSQAKEKLQQLPDFLKENGPWIKKLP